ncbi:hypothetical protein D3C73_1384000 [compost metagenome]
MPPAETKKHSHNPQAVSANMLPANPMPAITDPTRIKRRGDQSSRRTINCEQINARPTMVRAMPAVCAASAGPMPSLSMA